MGSRPDLPVWSVDPLLPATEPTRALSHRWDYRLVRTLLRLQSERWTGSVRVRAEGVSTAIRLREGRPVFVEGGLPADSLGRALVQRGWITEAQLAEVVEERMSIQGRQRFGDVAVDLEILDEAALAAALDAQVRDKLIRCLHWEHGELELEEDDHGEPHREGVPLTVEPLLLEGVFRYFSEARVQQVLESLLPHPAQLIVPKERIAQRFQLGADSVALLDLLLNDMPLGAALDAAAERRTRAGQLACVLALTDQLELRPAPSETASETSSAPSAERSRETPTVEPADNDQLGGELAPDATGPRLRLVRKSQPVPVLHAKGVGDDDRVPSRDKLLSDSAFLQGRELLRVGEYAAAADALKTASALRPGAREYALHAAWAGYLAGGRNTRWRARLEAHCRGALAQDRHLAFAHHVLGQLALEDGDRELARESLGRALELDPNDDIARAALLRLDP